jgi:hypothetical protein
MMKGWQKGALISGGIAAFILILGRIVPGSSEIFAYAATIIIPLLIPLIILIELLASFHQSLHPTIYGIMMIVLIIGYFALLGAIAGYILSKISKRREDE